MSLDGTYDDANIFAKILRGEAPATRVYENDDVLAFMDVFPQSRGHVLVIPKGPYVSWDDFTLKADDAEIAGFMRAIGNVTRQLGIDESGYRLLVNMGGHGHQEVPHLHVHIFGGRQFRMMIPD